MSLVVSPEIEHASASQPAHNPQLTAHSPPCLPPNRSRRRLPRAARFWHEAELAQHGRHVEILVRGGDLAVPERHDVAEWKLRLAIGGGQRSIRRGEWSGVRAVSHELDDRALVVSDDG